MIRSRIQLPLLAKELTEQAARPRMYLIRFLYALVLFTASVAVAYQEMYAEQFQMARIVGQGRDMFRFLNWTQMVGIFALVPALVSGAITTEKERNTLHVLMLTDLRPWEIVIQKLLSRIATVLTFLLLNMPLLALCYAYGGLTSAVVAGGAYTLALTSLQVGALSVMCSAFFHSTAGAFIGTYLGLIASIPFMPIARGGFQSISAAVRDSGPAWFSIVMFLCLARVFLTWRMRAQPRNLLYALFRRLDRGFSAANRRVARGVELVRDTVSLPGDKPVAWMERTRRSIGKPQYLMRIALAVTLPPVVICVLTMTYAPQAVTDLMIAVILIGWFIAMLWLAVQATVTFSTERSRQTLGVLLTTPIPTRRIVREKVSAVWRFAAVLALPLLAVSVLGAWFRSDEGWGIYHSRRGFSVTQYLTVSALAIAVYMPMIVWLGVYIGMSIPVQGRAIVTAVAAIVAMCMTPVAVAGMIMFAYLYSDERPDRAVNTVLSMSPMVMLFNNESDRPIVRQVSPTMTAMLNFALYFVVAWASRFACYRRADRLLGRV